MPMIPRAPLMTVDPQAAYTLTARWQRTRGLLVLSTTVLPFSLVLVCLAMAALVSVEEVPWWSMIPVVGTTACGITLTHWLRRHGLTEPQSWFPAVVLMTSTGFLLGVVPGFGIALNANAGTPAGVLLVLGLGCTGAAWFAARRAHDALVCPLVVELGSTGIHLVLNERPLASAEVHLEIGTDRVGWAVRRRDTGARMDAVVSFTQLQDVSVMPLAEEPALASWLDVHDDTALMSVVVLETKSGQWAIPVDDAALVCELLVRRKALWDSHFEAEVVRERELYLELLELIRD
jgi:hypothetical protein